MSIWCWCVACGANSTAVFRDARRGCASGLVVETITPPLSLLNALMRTVRTGRGELAVDWVVGVGITDARVAFQLLFCRTVLPDLVRLVHIDCNRFIRRCCTASASSPAAVNRLIPSMHTVNPMLDGEPLDTWLSAIDISVETKMHNRDADSAR
jgi:hypothetical protein